MIVEGLKMDLNKELQNGCFTRMFPKIFTKTFFFWNANGWVIRKFKQSFSKTPMDAPGWINKI